LQRNAHRSVIHGFRFSGAEIHFISPSYNKHFDAFAPVTPAEIEKALEEFKIEVVVVTSPTYEGFIANLNEIGRLCSDKDVRLLVDGAHGALFPFHTDISLETGIGVKGVDIVVQSMHKCGGSFS
jgi:arginine decarboxylase